MYADRYTHNMCIYTYIYTRTYACLYIFYICICVGAFAFILAFQGLAAQVQYIL